MFKPTVAKIVSSFQKNIDQLESLAAASAVEVNLYNQQIIALEEKRAASDIESTRATVVAKKIRDLIGGE